MIRPARFWMAWGLCALSLVLTLGAWARELLSGAPLAPRLVSEWLFSVVPPASAVLAALILGRRPRHPVGWLLMLQGVGNALAFFVSGYLNGLAAPPANPSLLFLALVWFSGWSWLLLIFPLFFIPLFFPTGRLLSPRWRWVLALGLGMALFFMTLGVFAQELGPETGAWTVRNPLGLIPVEAAFDPIMPFWSLGLVALAVLSLASVILRYRRGGPVERQQIKWLLFGCALFALVYVISVWEASLAGGWLFESVWNLVFPLALLTIPASIAISILRYRLWDIDVIIRRTLVYSALTGLLALVYFGSVVALQSLLRGVVGGESQVAIVLSTLVIAALFVPLRARVQRAIDRRFYRRKYDAARTLAAFAASARDETDLARLSLRLTDVVHDTMQPASVELWVRPDKQRGQP